MHIAFVSLGAFGHVNPTLQLASELVARGERVTYFCPEDFRKVIEPTGATFVAVPSWMADNDPQKQETDQRPDDKSKDHTNPLFTELHFPADIKEVIGIAQQFPLFREGEIPVDKSREILICNAEISPVFN